MAASTGGVSEEEGAWSPPGPHLGMAGDFGSSAVPGVRPGPTRAPRVGGGCAGAETAGDEGAEAPRGAGGEAGDGGGDAEAGTAGGTGGGTEEGPGGEAAPAAAGNTRRRQEPTWLQDEDDELWPEFPPCSSPEGATSPTTPTTPTSPVSPTSPTSPMSPAAPKSPTAGTTEDAGGSKRAAPAGGPRDKAAPGSAGQRLRLEGAGGRPRVGSRAQGRSAILEKFGGGRTCTRTWLPVPDAKCVYTYVQELYRCLVAKGLVKTKKR
ncbi:PREDICTED: collagen alpha-1(III) chain-like [Ficedula albicollis]|uniref:collagen alpha-1(III) chain-like n=1 Tax=Ficedula albicollis TaxID=59894 RepID=UPI0007AD958D|nr:PREDICTED: collagen alpha-1(III) chain-like [Ficedula albicollis]